MTTPTEPGGPTGPAPEAAASAPVPGPQAGPHEPAAERVTRRSILAGVSERRRRNRPYVIAGWVVLLLILAIPTFEFVRKFVLPPRELALRVEDVEYSRGDLVNFIRFNQRLSEQAGQKFEVGTSLFDALTTMSENEIAFHGAPALGVTVETAEVDRYIQVSLGFYYLSDAEAKLPANKAQIDEAFRQFLTAVRLDEPTYREIVRRELFKSKVRDRLAGDVDRIQEQVHVYEIRLDKDDKQLTETLRRRLKAGETFSELALKYSVEVNVRRNNGDLGWLPRRVLQEYDNLFFGLKEDGTRILPLREPSNVVRNPVDNNWTIYYVDEYVSAREVDADDFEVLKDRALRDWLDTERKRLDVHLVLNDRIYNWVNKQVRLASILPTPTPYDPLQAFGVTR